ncbi:MAG: hypothetical protein ACK47B_01710 [Armatimonadota bacterium]
MSARRGMLLTQWIGALFVGGLVLGTAVPLYLTAQREAALGVRRARLVAAGREAAARIEQDLREARAAQVSADGRSLRLTSRGAVRYASTAEGLLRERRDASGTMRERAWLGGAALETRFRREGRAVAAHLRLRDELEGRRSALDLQVLATPRAAP